MRLRFLLADAAAAMALAAGTPSLAKPLEYEVIPTGPVSMFANVTLIKGDKGAVLVDVPFARSDAYRVAAAVLDSGRHLDTIVITHDHPDHFFGLDVLADAFPDAKIVANPVAAKDMARSIPIKFKRWSGQLGINAPHRPVQPTAMTGDTIDLEGHKLDWLRLRDKARRELGSRFDIRRFHDAGLLPGAMPLTVLDQCIDAYIAAAKA